MIYLIGGAPRVGKSVLAQDVAASLRVGWISTDLLLELLRMKNADGVKRSWDSSPTAIRANAEWFFPYLEKFIWGVNSMAESYVIEGVDFLPEQIARLSTQYQLRSVFLGRSELTLKTFDEFPGRSRGYANLSEEFKRQIVHDVPLWGEMIRKDAEQFGFPYVDMSGDFLRQLVEAKTSLTAGS